MVDSTVKGLGSQYNPACRCPTETNVFCSVADGASLVLPDNRTRNKDIVRVAKVGLRIAFG